MAVLLLALLLTIATVLIHTLGTSLSLTWAARLWQRTIVARDRPRLGVLMACLVSMLLATHLLEAALWSVIYWWRAMLPSFSTAVYYSMTSYTTVGYGDILLPDASRLLGPLESMVGVLMLGWSTAVVVAVVNRFYREVLKLPK